MKRKRSIGLFAWWLGLCTVSIINIGVLGWFWIAHRKKRSSPNQRAYLQQRRQLELSTVFVLGCAFRSYLPRADVQRIALVDSCLSSILVGRTVATIAELSFVAQWAQMLESWARPAKLNEIVKFSRLIFPAISLAEVFSWLGVLTTNNFWHVLEESIWGASEIGLTISALVMRRKYQGALQQFMGWMALCGAIYVAYMFTLDIPTYYSRWRRDQMDGKEYTGFEEGLRKLAFHWRLTYDPHDWQGEYIWMMIYFSLGVWVSLALTQAPLDDLEDAVAPHKKSPSASVPDKKPLRNWRED